MHRALSFALLLCVACQVDKIFGPGNQYVTAAKMALQVGAVTALRFIWGAFIRHNEQISDAMYSRYLRA